MSLPAEQDSRHTSPRIMPGAGQTLYHSMAEPDPALPARGAYPPRPAATVPTRKPALVGQPQGASHVCDGTFLGRDLNLTKCTCKGVVSFTHSMPGAQASVLLSRANSTITWPADPAERARPQSTPPSLPEPRPPFLDCLSGSFHQSI